MNRGYLSTYFLEIAAKRLSSVEVNPESSNQHEFNGVGSLQEIFGTERLEFRARIIYFGDFIDESINDEFQATWYDAREAHPSRTEYRLYYPSNRAMEHSQAGDLMVIGKQSNGSVLIIISEAGSAYERLILWLFDLDRNLENRGFLVHDVRNELDSELDYASRIILSELGIELEETNEDFLETMLAEFNNDFPTTRKFSDFSRNTLQLVSPIEDPDQSLLDMMVQEEILFRTLENYFVNERIQIGFEDVDSFINYSLSIQNRRKSRAGFAFENHLEYIFITNQINYTRGGITENRSRPDFIFPGIEQYHDMEFEATNLTMLGAKSTCKDRWRQVLSEAERISLKHLVTLEPGISINQTNEMKEKSLQLVIPHNLQETFLDEQRNWLMNLKSFIQLVIQKQSS